MGTITKRTTKNGKIRYVASVRQNRKGNNFSQSKTFSKESLAKEWIRKTEAELELNGNIAKKPTNDTLATLILRYRDEVGEQFNPKYITNLTRIATYPIAHKTASNLTRQDFPLLPFGGFVVITAMMVLHHLPSRVIFHFWGR